MDMKCRILSVIVIVVSLIVTLISLIVVANKKDDKVVYAQSISFNSDISGFEMAIDNYLVIDKSLVTITPSNCTLEPEFSITKSTSKQEMKIGEGRYKFSETGKHVLKCKVKINEENYWHDQISIIVVESPSNSTSMYIQQLKDVVLYVDDIINLDKVIKVTHPINTAVAYNYDNYISIINNNIKAIYPGLAKVEVVLNYHNILISEEFSVIVRSKIIESEIGIEFSVAGNVLDGNIVEIKLSKYNFAINYELINTDFQTITCYTYSDSVTIISFDAPIMVIKANKIGEAIIFISPTNYPNTMFELVVRVLE